MKERPILMSAPMVRAVLDGTKTQTRRLVKVVDGDCPYGRQGDRLWVRETYANLTEVGHSPAYVYRADDTESAHPYGLRWRPSIHMPRAASRIMMEITDVRTERLHDISDEDILAEGVTEELARSLIHKTAMRQKTESEHWIHGSDESLGYCYRCAKKEVRRLRKKHPGEEFVIAGGYGTENDSIAFCETCEALLDSGLTDCGAAQEFEHFLDYGIRLASPFQCYSALLACDSSIWRYDINWKSKVTDAPREKHRDEEERYHRFGWMALWCAINGQASWVANPWVWTISFRRVDP